MEVSDFQRPIFLAPMLLSIWSDRFAIFLPPILLPSRLNVD